MDRFQEAEKRFIECLRRGRDICELQDYLSATYAAALDTSDMLRAAVVLSVSAFDFLIHELYRVEVLARYNGKKTVQRLRIPFEVAVADPAEVEGILEAHVKDMNSYRSFVDPAKFAEAMGCFADDPWNKVAAKVGKDSVSVKRRVRSISRWRNRIVHEADINPVLSGVALFPIIKADVVDAIDDLEGVGLASIEVLRDG